MPRWWSAMQAMSLRGGRLRLRALAGGAVPLTSSAPSLPPSFPFRSYSSLLAHPFTQSSSCLLPCHRPPCFSIPFPLSSSSSSSLVSSLLCVHRVPVRTIKRVARKKLKSHRSASRPQLIHVLQPLLTPAPPIGLLSPLLPVLLRSPSPSPLPACVCQWEQEAFPLHSQWVDHALEGQQEPQGVDEVVRAPASPQPAGACVPRPRADDPTLTALRLEAQQMSATHTHTAQQCGGDL